DPASGVDQHAHDAAARAGDSDRLVALGRERSAGTDRAPDLAAAGNDDGHGRDLPRAAFRRLEALLIATAAHHHEGDGHDRREGHYNANNHPAPLPRPIG